MLGAGIDQRRRKLAEVRGKLQREKLNVEKKGSRSLPPACQKNVSGEMKSKKGKASGNRGARRLGLARQPKRQGEKTSDKNRTENVRGAGLAKKNEHLTERQSPKQTRGTTGMKRSIRARHCGHGDREFEVKEQA